jgi:hypothetical protein
VDGGDDLDDDERAVLHRELEASMAEAEAGELVDLTLGRPGWAPPPTAAEIQAARD